MTSDSLYGRKESIAGLPAILFLFVTVPIGAFRGQAKVRRDTGDSSQSEIVRQ